jgi:hypothetical protein
MEAGGSNIPWKPLTAGAVAAAAVAVVLGVVFTSGGSGVDLADSGDPEDRRKAAGKLDPAKSDAEREALYRLARDPDIKVARHAVRSTRHIPTLQRILTDRKIHKEVRRQAAVTLAKTEADTEVLVAALDPGQEPDAEVRAGAAEGLRIRLEHSTIPQLFQALRDPSREVRVWAIAAIHKMIARKFPYRAELPPSQQTAVIERIRKYLVWAKLM